MKQFTNTRKRLGAKIATAGTVSALAAAMTATTLFTTIPVYAAQDVEMSTDYTGIYVKPGDSVSFSLDFNNRGENGENIELSQSGLPDGWTGSFQGNGKQISAVFAKSGENDSLATYQVTIPDDAQKGAYNITLKGDTSSLKLQLNVTDENIGTSELTTDYYEQQGTSGTSFSFNTTLQNSTSAEQSYALSAQAPAGWKVSFKPSDSQTDTTSATVGAHSSNQVAVTIASPADVAAGDYEIPVSAVSGDQNLQATLKVTITGSYDTQIQTSDGTLSFTANSNHKKAVSMDIVNNGNLDLEELNLTASAPSGWEVEFAEPTIDSLPAGQTKTVTLYVTPSSSSISGDYTLSVKAANEDTSANSVFRVTVKTGTSWGIAGVGIIAAVIAALAAVIHKFGRK